MAFKFYKQPDTMDCGPTCLRMISKHYGADVPLQLLREKAEIGKEGVNLLGISNAAESIGFRTHPVRISYQSLVTDANIPVMLHWEQNHFVVLYKIRKKSALLRRKEDLLQIADPGKGLLTYTKSEFLAHWISDEHDGEGEGIALLLEPSPAFYEETIPEGKKNKEKNKRDSNIFRYILPHKKLVAQLFIGLMIGTVLQAMLPFLTQSIVDTGISTTNIHFVYTILFAQLALLAGRLVTEFVRGWILLHISTRINISILTDFLIKLMKLPASFFDSKHTGDILQRMNDHKRIEAFLTGNSLTILFSLVNLVVFSFVLASFNFTIFLLFIISSILYSCWVLFFLKKRRSLDYKKFGISAQEQGSTIQLVQGMQDIKLNGAERPMRWAWERLQAKLFKLSVQNLSLNQWQQAGTFFINEGKNVFITFVSAKAVIDGQMTLGAMLAVQYIIGQLNSPIEQMTSFIQNWQNAKISMDRLNEIHEMEDEEPADIPLQQEIPPAFARQLVGGSAQTVPALPVSSIHDFSMIAPSPPDREISVTTEYPVPSNTSAIHFKNVSFAYPGAGNEPVLKNINISIPRGKTTAIVGVSGSGKTTLLKMLLKFYRPQQGEIKLDNLSLNNISHKAWRAKCGVVMQESFIFSDTIARNIAVGQEKIDTTRLAHAVEAANIRGFIESLPLGYNTKIGAEGSNLSMGQKQRILIARSVYRDPDFIFFDEATNSLDANNESIIIRNLESFFKDRTVVVVAHRLSTVRHADQIIVINGGTITETGTHQDLISIKGEYYQLVKNQLELGN